MHGLSSIRVVDLSEGIPGAYASKLMADAGADVIKVESAEGDPLRRWSATGAELGDGDGALFQFLHTSKRSLIGAADDEAVLELIAGADLLIDSAEPGVLDALDPCGRFPGLVWLSITPWGRGGPYSNRPASEFTVQAESGALGGRGRQDQPPIMCGGRTTEWIGGTFAACASLAAVQRAQRSGQGEHVDFALIEVMNIAGSVYADLMHSLGDRPPLVGAPRSVEVPSIEPTQDGWVGFNTNSRQQYTDFLLLIERPDLLEDEELAGIPGRMARMEEWNEIVRAWTTQHTTAEIVERASLLRIPVAPVNDGRSVLQHEQFEARGVFVENPSGGFLQPRPPYLMDGKGVRPFGASPKLGEHNGSIEARAPRTGGRAPSAAANPPLPLEGIRVLDATAWWAGPSACQMLANLGADVIHLEAIQRPDGMRMMGGMFFTQPGWWERSGIFLGANVNKRGLTLNMADPEGLALVKRLIPACDVFVENFSPRVVESFGLDWDAVHALAPRTIMVRMPAFGLSGPWRDNVGFAQTMEQMTGLAWMTGHVDDQPRIQRGPCDPLAGTHAAFAALVGLAEREVTGEGHLLECTMVEGALNAAAEQIVEYSAYGNVMQRNGNRAPTAAPQNLYACRGEEQWLALSITSDAHWAALVEEIGSPAWARDPALASAGGRHAAHDRIDEELGRWAASRELEPTIGALVARGIPAAPVFDPRVTHTHPQLAARGLFEEVEHPVAGTHPMPIAPFRYASRASWLRNPAPTMGQHNREILSELLGLDDAEIDRLEAAEVIGDKPKGL